MKLRSAGHPLFWKPQIIVATKIDGSQSVKNLERADIHYPQLTENQVNYSDCTNHGYGPLSCNQAPDRANLFPPHQSTEKSLLVAGLNNLHDVKRTIAEDFSVPAPILDNTQKLAQLLVHDYAKFDLNLLSMIFLFFTSKLIAVLIPENEKSNSLLFFKG